MKNIFTSTCFLLTVFILCFSCNNGNSKGKKSSADSVGGGGSVDSMQTLYLWGSPAFGSYLATHTYVTNYNTVSVCPPNGIFYGSDFWYCWGGCHTWKTPSNPTYDSWAITSHSGNAALAERINQANVEGFWPSSVACHAGITGFYGYRGVCHQVANRTLYATYWSQNSTAPPITLPDTVAGYRYSHWAYGTYGRNLASQFKQQIVTVGGDSSYVGNDDDTLESNWLRAAMKEKYTLAALAASRKGQKELHALMDDLGNQVNSGKMTVTEYATAVNKKINEIFQTEIIPVIGPDVYKKMYGAAAKQPISIIEMGLAKQADAERKK